MLPSGCLRCTQAPPTLVTKPINVGVLLTQGRHRGFVLEPERGQRVQRRGGQYGPVY